MISVKGWEMGTLSGSATSGQCLDSGGLTWVPELEDTGGLSAVLISNILSSSQGHQIKLSGWEQ